MRDVTQELIKKVYAAPHHEEGWSQFFNEFLSQTRTKSGLFSVLGGIEDKLQPQVIAGFRENDIEGWVEHYAPIDPYMEMLDKLPSNYFYRGDDIYSREAFLRSEVFNTWSREQDVYYASGAFIDVENSSAQVHIALQRGKSQGPHTDEEQKLMNVLLPHIQQAVSFSDMFVSIADVQQQQLDALVHPAFLCDEDCRVSKLNAAAESLCRDASLISVVDKKLLLKGEANLAMKETVKESAHSPTSLLRSKTIRLGQGRSGQVIRVVPWWSQRGNFSDSKNLVLVVVQQLVGATNWPKADLLSVFDFTPREADVALLLAQGLSPMVAAEQLAVSDNTIRTHIKAILNKTNAASLQEFVAVMNSLESPFI